MPNSASVATSPVSSQSELSEKKEKRQLTSSFGKAESGIVEGKPVRDKR